MGEQLSRFIIGIVGIAITLLLACLIISNLDSHKETYESVGKQIEQMDLTEKKTDSPSMYKDAYD